MTHVYIYIYTIQCLLRRTFIIYSYVGTISFPVVTYSALTSFPHFGLLSTIAI